MDRRKLRRLLASSSFAAILLAGGNAARAQADLTNPAGSTTAFLRVDPGDVVDDVRNEGLITNAAGEAGIRVVGTGQVLGEIDNDGTIAVTGTTEALGILVRGTSALIGEGISNDGLIDVAVFGSGTGLRARGISIEGSNTVIAGNEGHRGIANDEQIRVHLEASDFVGTAGGTATAEVGGIVDGIFVGTDVTLSGGVHNQGEIDVSVTLDATAFATGAASGKAVAGATGLAWGIYLEPQTLDGGFVNNQQGGPGEVFVDQDLFAWARATSTNNAGAATATAIATVGGTDTGSVFGIDLHVPTIFGGFSDTGIVHVANYARANATAHAIGDTALANGSAFGFGEGTGVHILAQTVVGDIVERGNVRAVSTVDVSLNVHASGGTGGASANGNINATGTAKGLRINVDSLSGDFWNSGDIAVQVDVAAVGRVTAIDTAQAAANAILTGSASAYGYLTGVTVSGTTVSGDLSNSDTLILDGKVLLDLKAVADSASGSASAQVTGSAGLSAEGLTFDVSTVAGNVRNDAAITMDLQLSALAAATARGQDSALADARISYFYAYGSIGAYFTVDTVGGDLTNTGAIQVTIDAHAQVDALATATSGPARATAIFDPNTEAVAAYGLYVAATSVGGDLQNSGDVTIDAGLLAEIGASAGGVGATSAVAKASAAGVTVSLFALDFFPDTVLGDVANSGNVDVLAQVTVRAEAKAQASTAAAAEARIDSNVQVTGFDVTGTSIAGQFRNEGNVEIAALIGHGAKAQATVSAGTGDAKATAAITSEADVLGFRFDVDSVLGGWSNSGDITVFQIVSAGASAAALNTGQGGATASAFLSIFAQATGMAVSATSIDGGLRNEGNLLVEAVVTARAKATATGVDGALATLFVTSGSVTVEAAHVDIDTLTGGFSNSGSVAAVGYVGYVGSVRAVVTAAGKGDAEASATVSDISLSVIGLDVFVGVLDGDLSNSGNITAAAAVEIDLGLDAQANGTTGDAKFTIAADDAISLTAQGLIVEVDTMTGNLQNSGDIVVQAKAALLVDAQANAANGNATGEANLSYSINTIVGIDVDVTSLAGNVDNSGDVTIAVAGIVGGDGTNNAAEFLAVAGSNAAADLDVTISVTASTITGASFEIDTMTGTFTNSGDVSIDAQVRVNLDATASGGTAAVAFFNPSVSIVANGLYVEMSTLTGDANNSGNVSVAISNVIGGATTGGAPTALVLARATNGNATAEFAFTEFTAELDDGVEFDIDTVFGSLANSGNISASAVNRLDLAVSAQAAAGSAFAVANDLSDWEASVSDVLQFDATTVTGSLTNSGAVTGFAQNDVHLIVHASASAIASALISLSAQFGVHARGINFDVDTVNGNLENSGDVTVNARNTADFEARATGTDAYAFVVVTTVTASATGIYASSAATLGGDFRNSGGVVANAFGRVTLRADANGTAVGTASARVTGFSDVNARGIELVIDTVFGDVANSGQVLVRADLEAKVSALAVGTTARAFASVSGITAHAVGYRLIGSTMAGDFLNSSTVEAIAEVDVAVFASAADTATAVMAGKASALAEGMWAQNFGTIGGSFVNDGGLIVAAADADGRMKAIGAGANTATVSASAVARGMLMDGGTLQGSMVNGGTVAAIAIAFASASAPGGTATAKAAAFATGLRLDVASLGGDVVNNGRIDAGAWAGANAIGTATSEQAEAVAIGIFASVTAGANGGVINNGSIFAFATSTAPALAIGQVIAGGQWSGSLVNATSGFISVRASDPDNARAIGLSIDGSAIVQGGIVNAGIVQVEAVADLLATARAIDLTNATGAGHRIQMLDGRLDAIIRSTPAATAVTGLAVAMVGNGQADTLDWSGGLIEAHIAGSQALDTMNVFAGKADTLNFEHAIEGMLALNVNTAGQAATPVEFRFAGIARHIEDLNVNENGTLVVGNNPGTAVEITANTYTQDPDGTLLFEIEPGDNNNGVITVNNVANLDGTIGVRPLAGLYEDTQSYFVIDGNLSGSFDNTEVVTPLLSVSVEQSSPDVVLTVTRNDFASVPGLTHNQNELGEALDDFYDPVGLAGSDIGAVVSQLFTLDTGELLAAYDDLAGAEYAQMAYAGFEQMQFMQGGVTQRLHDARSRSGGAGQSASLGAQSLQYAAIGADEGVRGTQMAAIGNDPDHPGSVWGKGYGSWGKLDGDDEAPGYDRTTGAVIVGLDYRFGEEFLVGIAGAYSFSSLDFDDGDDGDIDSWQIGLFGSWDSGTWYVDGLVSYAFQSYETERRIDFLGEKAKGDYDGGAVQVYGEVGYQFALGEQALLTPLVGLGWTSVWTDDFTEKGAGGANLKVDEASYDSLATTLGVRGSLAFEGWEPSLFLGWRHEFLDDHGEADLAFAAVPDSKWQVIGSDVGSDAGLVGVGVVAEISAQFEAVVDYSGQFSGSGNSHTGSVGLRLKF